LLRLPEATSKFSELTTGRFQELIDDTQADANKVRRVLMVSGKLYYDLAKRKATENREDVAVVRLEQVYPLPVEQIKALQSKYKNAQDWRYVQDEPENMGAWSFLLRKLRFLPLDVVCRPESASPATGYKKVHLAEHKSIMDRCFEPTLESGSKKAKKELSKA